MNYHRWVFSCHSLRPRHLLYHLLWVLFKLCPGSTNPQTWDLAMTHADQKSALLFRVNRKKKNTQKKIYWSASFSAIKLKKKDNLNPQTMEILILSHLTTWCSIYYPSSKVSCDALFRSVLFIPHCAVETHMIHCSGESVDTPQKYEHQTFIVHVLSWMEGCLWPGGGNSVVVVIVSIYSSKRKVWFWEVWTLWLTSVIRFTAPNGLIKNQRRHFPASSVALYGPTNALVL